MNKAIRFVQTYLVIALPLVLACMAWGTVQTQAEALQSGSTVVKVLWEVLSWNLMIWFGVLIVFLVALVASPLARENTLKRLANIQERDEREQFITGKASRAAYISSLSLLMLFLFFSIFTLNVTRPSPTELSQGDRGSVSIGLQFNLWDKPAVTQSSNSLFETTDLPLSKSAIILILMAWQLLAFNLAARKEHRA